MTLVEIILIALGLAMDASAVSLAAACSGFAGNPRAIFRLSFHFGLFQALMPIIGWFIGSTFVGVISRFDHWIAFGVLALLGAKMIRAGLVDPGGNNSIDPSRGMYLVSVSIATSIDALAVGLSLALLDIRIWYPALIIGLVTMGMSVTAIVAGRRLGMLFGKKMEVLGGTVLIFVGFKILLSHLSG